MACYAPLKGWYARERNPETRKRAVVFRFSDGFHDRPVLVPCGTCIGCLLEKARQWAVRCMHEASLYDHNVFVTLTYDDEHLPPNGSLRKEDLVLFMKRLRAKYGEGIRFFGCGEYGEHFNRPHYHVLLFNHRFPDQEKLPSNNKNPTERSAELEQLWPFGFSSIGNVTFDSAGYVARYTLKKIRNQKDDYRGREPEFLNMSRRPGIGRAWITKYHREVYPSDELLANGHLCKPPRFYDDVVEKLDSQSVEAVKKKRRVEQAENPDNTCRRLDQREEVKLAATRTLKRELT